MAYTNRLIKETSPYLLQHAHNPVDWYPWGDEALQKAKEENKPILVSIGYSACHWCHVMEKESFENPEVAALMNKSFINIKIDREERPDIDNIYMDAVQVMTGSGGWPLNVFLTPEAKPFYGGTYFPPTEMHNRLSWIQVLHNIDITFKQKETEVIAQAENLTTHLLQSNLFNKNDRIEEDDNVNKENAQAIYFQLMKIADRKEGGFGTSPKFPQTFSIQYLLRYYHFYKEEEALKQACLSLDKMIQGGIYDQIGGGMARYATDNEWLIPHFEKMLYDNALLITVLSEAYQITHHKRYNTAIKHIMTFVEREMLSEENGFYSALDADSEGVEGKFYVWNKKEIEEILKNDAELFCNFYNVSENGNWEDNNILNITIPIENFIQNNNIDKNYFETKLEEWNNILLQHRNKRKRPLLDDKILLGWNALMNIACSKAFAATGEIKYRDLAISNMDFIFTNFSDGNLFFHTYKNKIAKHTAFLDDYAFLIQALIQLHEVTAEGSYLMKAKKLTEDVINYFEDKETGLFFFTNKNQKDIIIRKKEIYDGAIPSGNSVMSNNLFYLSYIFDNKEWKKMALNNITKFSSLIVRYPNSFGNWANVFLLICNDIKELVITGKKINAIHFDILHNFMPDKVFQLSHELDSAFPLLVGKKYDEIPLIYLCENYVCKPPVKTLSELIKQLNK